MYGISVDSIVPKHGATVHIDWDNVVFAGMSPQTLTATASIDTTPSVATIQAIAFIEGALCTLCLKNITIADYAGDAGLLVSTLLTGTRYVPATTQYFPMNYSTGLSAPHTGIVKIEPSGVLTCYSSIAQAEWSAGTYNIYCNCYTYTHA